MAQIVEEDEAEEEDEEEYSEEDTADEAEAEEEFNHPSTSTPYEPLTLENLHLHPTSHRDSNYDHDSDDEDENENAEQDSNDGTETGTQTSAGRTDDGLSTLFGEKSRKRRPNTRTAPATPEELTAIVSDRLAKTKKSGERKHHGGKPVTSGVLGRMKGSKMRSDARRNIKESQDF